MSLFARLFGKKNTDNEPSKEVEVGRLSQEADTTSTPVTVINASQAAPQGDYQLKAFVTMGDGPEVVPVEKRIKKAFPSETGLYPHEILLLDYAEKFTTTQKDFQGFWLYQYGVSEVQKVLSSLVQRGYLMTGGIAVTLKKQTVANLKPILQDHGLKVSGKKDALIQSLLENVAEDELWAAFPEKCYQRTEKGNRELMDNAYIPATHRKSYDDLSPWDMNRLMHEHPGKNYREVIWDYLLYRADQHYQHHNYGLYRNTRLSTYYFLEEEDRYEEGFRYLAEVMYIDLSGCSNGYDPKYLYISARSFFPYEESIHTLPPAADGWLNQIQDELDWDDAELEQHLIREMSGFKLPMHLFTVQECARICILEKNNQKNEVAKIYETAEARFIKEHPDVDLTRDPEEQINIDIQELKKELEKLR